LKSDFNLLDAFRFLDIKGKGYLSKYDLEDSIKPFGIFATQNELYLFMRKFDADNDSLLKYTEFCDAITPKAVEYASLMTKRLPTYADDADLDIVFSYDTKRIFGKLLNSLIANEIKSEALR